MDGNPSGLSELAIDLAHEKLDFAPQFFVVWNFFAARNHNLQQGDFMPQFWEASQQDTKRFQPFWNAFRVIHAVHAKHNKVVGQFATQLSSCRVNVAAGGVARKFLERNADWKRCNSGPAPVKNNDVVRLLPRP